MVSRWGSDVTPDQDYSPEMIEYFIRRWTSLVVATEGGTGASGLGAGHGKRANLSDIKADLELAADRLPLYWQATEFIFRRQRRSEEFYARRRTEPDTPIDQRQYEPPIPSDALEQACYRMALSLGWRPSQENAA